MRVDTGIAVDGVGISIISVTSDTPVTEHEQPQQNESTVSGTLPYLILPRLPREPVRLVRTTPVHPRGSGDEIWPPESLLHECGDGPRVPTALLWSGIGRQVPTPWKWVGQNKDCVERSPAELLACTVRALLKNDWNQTFSDPVVVIPNSLTMAGQQLFLEACNQQGINARLLWRPIATAIVWCQQHHNVLAKRHRPIPDNNSCGTLLSVHLGIDELEITPLEVIKRQVEGQTFFLPARCRPDSKRQRRDSIGMRYVLECARRFLKQPQADAMQIWQRLCGSSRVIEYLDSARESLDQLFVDLAQTRTTRLDQKAVRIPWFPQPRTTESLDSWLNSHSPFQNPIGAVVTGDLTHVVIEQKVPLWRYCLRKLCKEIDLERVLIGSDTAEHPSILAQGAAIHAGRIASGQPSYLDTLPRIKTAVVYCGTPRFIDLLSDADEYVDGGKPWSRAQPLTGMHVAAGQQELELVLSHEEYSTVRTVTARLKQVSKVQLPVALEVSIEPAQGNARVDVVPERPTEGMKRFPVEWKSMRDTSLDENTWVESQPTAFPPLMPRGASAYAWSITHSKVEEFLGIRKHSRLFATDEGAGLREIATALSSKDPNCATASNEELTATAFSSDGMLAGPDQAFASKFILHVRRDLSSGKSKERLGADEELAVRSLGYTSTTDRTFLEYLAFRVKRRGSELQRDELTACGRCLRDPAVIAQFADSLSIRLTGKSPNNWLKAFGEILRYREEATRDIQSGKCENLLRQLLPIFKDEVTAGTFMQLFRNACVCIVFLLRRRMFDAKFLEVGDALQLEARNEFLAAGEKLRTRRSRRGGTLNPDRLVKLMVDLIDKKGPSLMQISETLRNVIDDG